MSRIPAIKDFPHQPVADMRISQGFGENRLPIYRQRGMLGHNGWDIPCENGTPIYAVADGVVYDEIDGGYGINARLFTDPDDSGEFWEVVYGHLQRVVKTGEVKAGEIIAYSDNTGYSTGPHLHFGIRRRKKQGSGSIVLKYDNGFLGYLDPTAFYDDEPERDPTLLPVDIRYGLEDTWTRRLSFAPHFLWLIQSGHWKHIGTREFNALKYGKWDLDIVQDPAMFTIWSKMTKPEYMGPHAR